MWLEVTNFNLGAIHCYSKTFSGLMLRILQLIIHVIPKEVDDSLKQFSCNMHMPTIRQVLQHIQQGLCFFF